MKKLFIFFAMFISIILLSGCGEDGQEGRAYLSFDWDWYVDWYNDNNPGVPYYIYENTDYESSAGTYSFEYGCSDGQGNFWSFYGTYTLTVNPGEEGSLFSDGADGADKFYTLYLRGSGAWLNKPSVNITNKEKKQILVREYNDSDYDKVEVGEKETETYQYKYGTLTVTKQAVQWIKK